MRRWSLLAAFVVVASMGLAMNMNVRARQPGLPVQPHPATVPPVRVMPLGDSITNDERTGGYRDRLWQRLVRDDKIQIDFVGSRNQGSTDLSDGDNEGHSGWWIKDHPEGHDLYSHVTGWIKAAEPDVVLLHIGTNDLVNGAPGPLVLERLDALLTKIYDTKPKAKIVVASIIPVTYEGFNQDAWREYHAGLPTLVAHYRAAARTIWLADMSEARLTAGPDGDVPDGVHPGAVGYAKMAGIWYRSLQPVVLQTAIERGPVAIAP